MIRNDGSTMPSVAIIAPHRPRLRFWFNNYSSGLSYFYFISGLLNILTMWYLRMKTDDAKLLAGLEAYREQHKNDPKKVSGLQARLEALQKMQQEQAKRR